MTRWLQPLRRRVAATPRALPRIVQGLLLLSVASVALNCALATIFLKDRHAVPLRAAAPLRTRHGTMKMDGVEVPVTIQPDTAVPKDPLQGCLLYTSPSPRDGLLSRMPSSA